MSYNTNATDIVFNFIAQKIQSNEWKPGEKIWSELVLCKHLSVSRVAVRQAIEKLSAMSVLRKKQGSGTYVEDTDELSLLSYPFFPQKKEDLIYMLEFRKGFDTNNVCLFIERASDEEFELLEDNYKNMMSCIDDVKKFHYYDYEFHNIIARGTKNPIIIQITNIFTEALENHQTTLYKNSGPNIASEYHANILKYIKERNVDLASIFTRVHIELTIKKIQDTL